MCKIKGFVLVPVSMIDSMRRVSDKLTEGGHMGNLTDLDIENMRYVLNQFVRIACDQLED